jgi:hypothetical protein
MPIFLIVIALALSAFIHLWNPIGFPYFHGDEGHYIRRAMHLLEGLGPQETKSEYDNPYDHPYFGQLFLAGIFSIIGYPHFLTLSDGSVEELKISVGQLYLFPRIMMGLFAVLDTFLIYKITERMYSRNAAIVAAVLFAVMPLTWLTRRVVLESIFLPLILSSIICAVYLRPRYHKDVDKRKNGFFDKETPKSNILVLISGTLLGLAILTKITAILIVPLLIYLIFVNSNKNFKPLRLWFLPVLLIPMIWPGYAFASGQLQEWVDGVLWQSDRDGRGLFLSFMASFRIDPLLWIVGLTSVVLVSSIKRELFFVLWLVPFLLFYSLISFMQHFHYIFLLPMLCMAAGVCTSEILSKIIIRITISFNKPLLYGILSAIFIFGFVSTVLLITTNLNDSLFEAQALVIKSLPYSSQNNNESVILVGSNWMQLFSWIPEYIFGKGHSFETFGEGNLPIEQINTKKILLLVDGKDLERFILAGSFENQWFYNNTRKIAEIGEQSDYYKEYRDKYPYTSIHENRGIEGGKIIMKANY